MNGSEMTRTKTRPTRVASVSRATGIVGRVNPSWWGILTMGVGTAAVVLVGSGYQAFVLDSVLMACLGAIALQVLQGTAGLVSVGNAAFMMIGAYATVFMLRSGLAFPFDMIGAAVVAAVAGGLTGLPALRLRALFLALATVAAHFIAVFVANQYQSTVPEAQYSGFFIHTLFRSSGVDGAARNFAWLLFGIVALVIVWATRVMSERTGRALRMIRDHELVAPTLGISVSRYKLSLFAATSLIIGIQGSLFAHFIGSVSTDQFPLILAFQYVAMIIIGGLDSIAGAVIGAVVVTVLPIWVPSWVAPFFGDSRATTVGPNVALMLYGLLVIVFVTASPGGIVGLFRSMRGRVAAGVARRAG
jgi:branched-chain amino acid transport system permease protein